MGISSGISTRWLFVHCVRIELEFKNVLYLENCAVSAETKL